MKKLITLILIVLAIIMTSFKDHDQRHLSKITTNDSYSYIAINNILMYISNNGDGSHDPHTDGNGLYWPRERREYYDWYGNPQVGYYTQSAIFEDGLVWGGKINTIPPDTQNIRVNGNTHRQGLQAGKILPNGKADDASNPKYRVYKIRKDWQSLVSGSVKDAYQKDYEEWPWQDGAPWIDNNNDGIYTPYADEPDFIGDEVLWYVANDLDTSRSTFTYGSLPLGLEQQCTVWGFDRGNNALGNMVFKRYRMINKGIYDIDSVYFNFWTDPDLGDAHDDYIGVDTLIQMGYAYNATNEDGVYGIAPPAVGYVVVQSPYRKAGPTDKAYFNDAWHNGYINTRIVAFPPHCKNCGKYVWDPSQAVYRGTIEWWNLMHGKHNLGSDIIDPHTGLPEKIALAGDPVTGIGWYEGEGWPGGLSPYDRRFWITNGLFKIAQGDTQDVVYAIVIGRGEDNIDSISKIRRLARIAQKGYYNNFNFPEVPQPELDAVLRDQQISLYWRDNSENYSLPDPYLDAFEANDSVYNFEGYRVWQFSNLQGSDPRVVAIFDLENNIDQIYDYREISGIRDWVPLFRTDNSGLQRSITLREDALTGNRLYNGSSYYFAVTAFAYNRESDPAMIESQPRIIEVIPQKQNIDYNPGSKRDDLIYAQQIAGDGHGQIIAQIMDPKLLTGNQYRVETDSLQGKLVWSMVNRTLGDTLARNINAFDLDTTRARNFDGFKLIVQNQGLDSLNKIFSRDYAVKDVLEVASGIDVFNNYNSTGQWKVTAYPYSIGSFYEDVDTRQHINSYVSDVLGFDNYEVRFTSEEDGSEYYLFGYRSSFRGPITNDFKAINKVPFQIWNVGRDLTSSADDVRLKVKIRDNAIGIIDSSKYIPDSVWTRSISGNWEPIYAYLEPGSAYSDSLPETSGRGQPEYFYLHNIVIQGELPEPGTIIRIIPWRPLTNQDEFEFQTEKTDSLDYAKAKNELDKITVFPNPYFGSVQRSGQPGQGFMRFGNLPQKVTIRIYNLAGVFVTRLEKDNASPWLDWDLKNIDGKNAASGVYIAHLEMPHIGKKIIKLALVNDN